MGPVGVSAARLPEQYGGVELTRVGPLFQETFFDSEVVLPEGPGHPPETSDGGRVTPASSS